MWIKNVWHWICILVFFSGLIDLLLSRNKVFYKSQITNSSATHQISVCLKIDSSFYDCSSLEDENLLVCKGLKEYFQYVENEKRKTPRYIIQRFNQIKLPPLFKFDNIHNITKQYNYLNLGHLCALYKAEIDLRSLKNVSSFFEIKFFNKFNLTLKLFLFPENADRYLRFESLHCKNFDHCIYFDVSLTEYQSNLLPSNSDANCFNYSSKSFYFQGFELINSKSSCLQECFKLKLRLFDFFYTEKDDRSIESNRDEHYELLDSTLSSHVRHCQGQCSKPSCIWKYFHFRGLIYNSTQNHVAFKIRDGSILFEAIPYIDTFGFVRKSLGFISLFFKISILSLVLTANKLLRSKMQLDNSIKKSILSFALAILWLGLVCSFFYGSVLVRLIYDQYNQTVLTPYIYYDIPFVPSNFSVALCEAVSSDTKSVSLAKLGEPAKRFNSTEKFTVKFGYTERRLIFSNDRFFYWSFDRKTLKHCFSTDVYIKEAR